MTHVGEIDAERLRERYRSERAKRIRSDGIAQYRPVVARGSYAWMLGDPFEPRDRSVPPKTDSVEVTIIGGGLGGIVVGAELRKRGFEDIRVVDAAGDFGGNWYWNRFPGAQCDVESYIYLPMLEDVGYMPKMKYSMSSEIRGHLQSLARHYRLDSDALFRTRIETVEWLEEEGRWYISTDRGDAFRSRFIYICNGPLTEPKLPDIRGIESFPGHMFHTSRWDYSYTGGDENGGLTGLADKRVAIIGTGGTAVQAIPHLARSADRLFVFQRTPSAVDVRDNRPTDPEWFASLRPGWQRERMRNFVENIHGVDDVFDEVNDGWTRMGKELTALAVQKAARELGRKLTSEERRELLDMADFRTMENIRARVDAIVEDRKTAEALKPWYGRWCKRPCFHDEYLQAFNRSSVMLVDTDGKGVDAIEGNRIIAGGAAYEVDCIIFATGFSVGTNYVSRLGYDVKGRGGLSLNTKWENGLKTLHGVHVNGFPNMFLTGATQTGITYNYTHCTIEQAEHLAYILDEVRARRAEVVEVSAKAEQAFVDDLRSLARRGTAYYEECTPGYFSNEGDLDNPNGLLGGAYGLGPKAFWDLLAAWREEGGLQGLALETRSEAVSA